MQPIADMEDDQYAGDGNARALVRILSLGKSMPELRSS